MAKLQRKSAKVFAEDAIAGIGGIAQFGSLAAGDKNYSKDVDVIQALDAYKEGWSSAVTGNKSPALEDRNALDYLLSYQQAYIMQRGIPEWLSTETYYEGSVVASGSSIYISLSDNNTGNAVTNTTYWRKFYTPVEIDTFLANKSDINLSNLTNTGKITGSSFSVPSTTHENLVWGASGTSYIMPSNGYIYIHCGISTNQYISFNNTTKGYVVGYAPSGTNSIQGLVPVSKGDVVILSYTVGFSPAYFQFIYAEGSKSEA